MTVVIDCNILVVCLTSRSPYHYIYRALIEGRFDLLVSGEIILEYEEIIKEKYGIATTNAFISLLEELSRKTSILTS
jgi:predicted nucleic acid-binding protein